eukprot:s2641_g6.t6
MRGRAAHAAALAEHRLRDRTKRLRELGKHGRWQEALWQLREMQRLGPTPSVVTYNVVMNACDSTHASALMDELPRKRLQADAVTYGDLAWSLFSSPDLLDTLKGSVIAAHGREHQWRAAMATLQAMRHDRVQWDLKSAGAAISACAKSTCWEQAVALMATLEGTTQEPDVVIYSATIDACAHGRLWQLAVQMLVHMRRRDLPQTSANVVSYGAALRACQAEWMVALQLVADMMQTQLLPDVVAFNAALGACESSSAWRAGLSLLAGMARARVAKDDVSVALAVNACARARFWQTALALCAKPASAITCSAFTTACGYGRRWQLALSTLFDNAVASRSAVCWNATISACDFWPRSLLLLERLEEQRLRADALGYNSTLSTLEKGGQWRLALEIFRTLGQRLLGPDAISFNSVISALEKGFQWQLATKMLTEMPLVNIRPSAITFNATISACEKGEKWALSVAILQNMVEQQAVQPDVVSHNAAIAACESAGEWEMALAVCDLLPQRSLCPTLVTCNSCISACEKGLQWELALRLLAGLPALKLAADEISYSAAVLACANSSKWESAFALWDSCLQQGTLQADSPGSEAFRGLLGVSSLRAQAFAVGHGSGVSPSIDSPLHFTLLMLSEQHALRSRERELLCRLPKTGWSGSIPVQNILAFHLAVEGRAGVSVQAAAEQQNPLGHRIRAACGAWDLACSSKKLCMSECPRSCCWQGNIVVRKEN